jgi:hypothetical protein
LWCWIQWEAGDVDAVLVACVVGLCHDVDRVASSIYQIHAWTAQDYTAASAAKAGEGGEEELGAVVYSVDNCLLETRLQRVAIVSEHKFTELELLVNAQRLSSSSSLMNRQPSRAPSPTPTAFSGISNYRNDSYRPIRDRNAPAVPSIDYRLVSKTHFNELARYLAAYLARGLSHSLCAQRQLTRCQ